MLKIENLTSHYGRIQALHGVSLEVNEGELVALVGGNCNNGENCGADYLNLNNSAGNANWNIGASNFFSYRSV